MKNKKHQISSFTFLLACLFISFTAVANVKLLNHSKSNSFKYHIKKSSISNQHVINGKIVDSKTGESIPFCSIQLNNTSSGTSSNEFGEFQLKTQNLPVQLTISHLNYKTRVVTIDNTNEAITIKLTPLAFELEEITLNTKKDFFAYELAKKAFRKADVDSRKKKYGKAYYRQKSKNGDTYSEFSEIIYDIGYSTEGIKEWDILEGRYALKEGTVNNRNYTLLSKILKTYQQNSDDLIFPFRDNIEHYYNVKVIQNINSENGKIAVLSFEPKRWIKTPVLEAEAYINTETKEIVKLTALLKNDTFKVVRLKDKKAHKRNYTLNYEMAFKKDIDSSLVMDYMKVDQKFDYYIKDSLITNVSSTSTLSFFEHYKTGTRKRLGREFYYDKESDWQKLNAIGYNKQFWRENPIVKRTIVEQEIINAFNNINAFESIFLNSNQQVSSTQSNIDHHDFIKELEKNTINYNAYNPVEKVYLHTDKELFTNKENIWFSAYVTLGTKHHYSIASRVLYVDLINSNGEIVKKHSLALEQGRGKGNITIPKDLAAGQYQLRAYTNWMINNDSEFFFTKTLKIIGDIPAKNLETRSNAKNLDLQFFPEGGYAIANLGGRVAFKATGKDGLGKDVKGKIVDSNNKFITNFSSKEQGSGVFNLKPKNNEKYTAIINENIRVPLPKIADSGYTLNVSNINPKNIKVKIQASENLRSKRFYVVGHMHNERYYQGQFEFGRSPIVNFEIPKNKLPTGVFTLTLFSDEGIPMAERAIFIKNQNELNITASIDKTKLLPNGKVAIEIKVTDNRNWPVETDLSLAVTDATKFTRRINDSNILSTLFLESDIKGHIENPALFFNDKRRATRYRLELLMLTHGWRRIDWKKFKTDLATVAKKHEFQQGMKISGVAKKNNKPVKYKKLKMVAISDNEMASYTTNTNGNGQFTLPNFNTTGKTKVNYNAIDSEGKSTPVDVVLDPRIQFERPLPTFKRFKFDKITKTEKEYIKFTTLNIVNDSLNQFLATNKDGTLLNEVKIDGVKRTKKDFSEFDRDNMTGYNVVADHTIDPSNRSEDSWSFIIEELPNVRHTILQAPLGYDAAAQPRDQPNGALNLVNNIYLRGNTRKPVLWILDGNELEGAPSRYIMSNIAKVEVLKNLSTTAVYGPRGAGGVIILTSKTARTSRAAYLNQNVKKTVINGHAAYKEFYSPKYPLENNQKKYKDSRTTLYWNPTVRTDKDGKATLIFYNSDDAKQIQVVVEGLSKYGNPGVLIQNFGEEK